MTHTIALDPRQAERILHQLTICSYLIRDGGDTVRAELDATLRASLHEPADAEQFTDLLDHSRRYLDARIANATTRKDQATIPGGAKSSQQGGAKWACHSQPLLVRHWYPRHNPIIRLVK